MCLPHWQNGVAHVVDAVKWDPCKWELKWERYICQPCHHVSMVAVQVVDDRVVRRAPAWKGRCCRCGARSQVQEVVG